VKWHQLNDDIDLVFFMYVEAVTLV